MGFGSLWHWAIVLIVVLMLFGRGRISEIMGDFGKGLRGLKEGMMEEEKAPPGLVHRTPPEMAPAVERPAEAAR